MSVEQYQLTFLNSKNTFLKKQNKVESFLLYNYFKTSSQKLNITWSLCENSLCSKKTSFSNLKFFDILSKNNNTKNSHYILKQIDSLDNVDRKHLSTEMPFILELDKKKSNFYLSFSKKLQKRFSKSTFQKSTLSLHQYDSRFSYKNLRLRKNYSFFYNFEHPTILNYLIKATLVKNFTIFLSYSNTFFLFFNKYFSIFHSNVQFFSWVVSFLFLEKLFYNNFIIKLIVFDFHYKKLVWQTKNFRDLEILTLDTPFQNNFLKIQNVGTSSNTFLYNKNTCINTFFFNKYIFSKKKITSFPKLFITLLQYKHFFLLSNMKKEQQSYNTRKQESFFFKRHSSGISSKRTMVNFNTKFFKKIEFFDTILTKFKKVTKHEVPFLKLQLLKKSKFINLISIKDWNSFSQKKHLSIDKFLIPDWIEKGVEMEFYFKENIVRPNAYKKSKRIKKKITHFSKSILYVPSLKKYNTCKHYNFLYNKYNGLLKKFYFKIQKQSPFILHYRNKSVENVNSIIKFKNIKKIISKLIRLKQISTKKKKYSFYRNKRRNFAKNKISWSKKEQKEKLFKYNKDKWFYILPKKREFLSFKDRTHSLSIRTFSKFSYKYNKKSITSNELKKQKRSTFQINKNANISASQYFIEQYLYFVNKRVPNFQDIHSFFLLPDKYGRPKWSTKRFKSSNKFRYTLSHMKSTTLKPFKKKVNDRNFKQSRLFTKYRSFFSNANKKIKFSILTSFSHNLTYSIFSIRNEITIQKLLLYYYYYVQYKFIFSNCVKQQIENRGVKNSYFLKKLLSKNYFLIENIFAGVGVIPVNLMIADFKVTKFLNSFFEKKRIHLDFVSHISFKSAILLNRYTSNIFIFLYFFPLLFKSIISNLYKTKTFFFNFKKSEMDSILFLYYFINYIKYKSFTNKLFFHFVLKLQQMETVENTCKSVINVRQNEIIWNRITVKRMLLWNEYRYTRLGFKYMYSSLKKKRNVLNLNRQFLYNPKILSNFAIKKQYSTFNNVTFKQLHFNRFLLTKLKQNSSYALNTGNPYLYLYISFLNSIIFSKYCVNNEIIDLQQKVLHL